MISRKLSSRLERLESRIIPAGESTTIQVVFVAPDGRSRDGPRFTVPASPNRRHWRDSWRWKRNGNAYR
jgi:hypothetical protein